jgi:hypothetical protein
MPPAAPRGQMVDVDHSQARDTPLSSGPWGRGSRHSLARQMGRLTDGGFGTMTTHTRFTPALAVIAMLALGGASAARAQDTSAAARSDTSGYRQYQNPTDSTADTTRRTDSSGFKYNGPATDTTLKAEPGAQTGPTSGDSGKAGQQGAVSADTVVCKDGSNAAKAKKACKDHGGIDWAATNAAAKARSGVAPTDTTQGGMGAPSDTVLKAKPGTQTGPDTSAAGRADSGTSR